MNSHYEQMAAEYPEPPRNITAVMTEEDARVYLARHDLRRIIDEARSIVRAKWKHDAELRLETLYSLLCKASGILEGDQ